MRIRSTLSLVAQRLFLAEVTVSKTRPSPDSSPLSARGSACTPQCVLAILTLLLSALGAGIPAGTIAAEPAAAPERVRGFFCNARADSVDFLRTQAGGENEEMAANAVNKRLGKFSCAYYLPADAIYTGEHTIIQDGIVYKLQSYLFLPERVERWSGSAFGSLQESPSAKHDV